jgi:hypothetical protein
MTGVPEHLRGVFRDGEEGLCPPLTAAIVQAAEGKLGYRLPQSYLGLLRACNGGYLRRRFFPTDRCKSWAEDHVMIDYVMGIGGEGGIDSDVGSLYLIGEWDYPDVGVVISSDGHTAFMLDYSQCGPVGEPRVIWVDTGTDSGSAGVSILAPDFASFLSQLREPPEGIGY